MKVPEPRKLSSGNYFIQLRLNGISVPVTAPTAKECKRQAELIKAEHRAGKRTIVKKSEITLGEAMDNYIRSKTNTLSPSTIRGYKTIRRNYLQDIMGKRLCDISNWQEIINEAAGRYSPKTVKNTWRFVCSVLRENEIMPPKLVLPQIVPNERPWLEPEQILRFVDAVKDEPHEIPALLALHSLRLSEVMALTWDKVDLEKNTIRVAGAAVFDENQKFVFKTTNKNQTSTRTVPIMIPSLKDALAAVEDKNGLVVTCHPNTLWARINRTCEANGFPLVGVHGLRHSFASLAYHLGWSEQQTMETGGWGDPQTMHKIYTHLAAADRVKSQNTMALFFQKANTEKTAGT